MKNSHRNSLPQDYTIRSFARENRLLLFILLVGMAFRLSGIFWGLPFIHCMKFYHPDESKIIDGAYEFPVHILTNLDLRYPTAFHYFLGVVSLPLRLLPYPTDYYTIYTFGRLLSILFGSATILLTFFLVARIFDRRHALLAAFFIAFSMMHVANSAWATTDVLSSFFLTLYLLLLLRTLESESPREAIFTGISLGFLIGVKYTGAIAFIPLVVLFITRQNLALDLRKDPIRSLWSSLTAFLRNRLFWIIVLVSLGAFLLSTPGILRHPFAFVASLQYEGERLSKSPLPLYDLKTYAALFGNLSRAVGFPLAITSLLGIFLALFKRKDVLNALVLMLCVFALYFGSAMEARYYMLIMPILTLFASNFLFFVVDFGGSLIQRLSSSGSVRSNTHSASFQYMTSWLASSSYLGYALIVLVCLYAFLYSLGGIVSRYPDTRTQATCYIVENIPPGSSIGMGYSSKEHEQSWRYPKVDALIFQRWNYIKHPDYIVLSSYDYEQIRETLSRKILNPDYSLPREYWDEWYLSSPPTSVMFELNEQLWLGTSPEYCLLKKFIPRKLYALIEFPAPTIEIYARQKSEGNRSPECEAK